MTEQEAIWLSQTLAAIDANRLSPLINLGSGTREFRERERPWIRDRIMAPLIARGVRVVHCDIRDGDGIDLRADILDVRGFENARAVGAAALLCTNVLEHVPDPARFARRCMDLVAPGGLLILTVPHSYPHHRDPVDTMFRPTPEEIAALFPDCRIVGRAIIETGSYRDNLRKRPWIIFRQISRLPFPFLGWTKWKRSMMKFYWMVRPYLQSCVVLEKES